MRSLVSRLIQSQSLLSRLSSSGLLRSRRLLSSDSNKIEEPLKVEEAFKVEEAETIKPELSGPDKVLVLGGNGFVGSHVCKEAVHQGFSVTSFSRSGRSSIPERWADNVVWNQGSLLVPDSLKDVMNGVNAVISCVGGFGSNSQMYKINGTANVNAIRAAAEQGVKRFVYISAADFGVVNYLLQGYYDGKRAAEAELLSKFPYGGVILKPGFIHGTRRISGVKIPLGVIGSPLEMILQHAKPLSRLPVIGPLLTPPVSVEAVAKVALRAATDQAFPPGIVDVFGILRFAEHK